MTAWIRTSVFLLSLTALITAPLLDAEAKVGYLKMTGSKSGDIKGNATQKGFDGSIVVESARHEIVSPRDAVTGFSTGKRQHKPLVIRKRIDKATPVLNEILSNNEKIKTWELKFTTIENKVETVYYTVTLTNANIGSIKMITNDDGTVEEEVTFVYETIKWKYENGGVTHEDTWNFSDGLG